MSDAKPCRWGCDGSGKIRVDESTDQFCTCLIIQRIRDILGPDLCDPRMAPIASSPLFSVDGSQDHTTDNLLLRGRKDRFHIPHLRFVLSTKLRLTGLRFRYQMVDDERLKNVWVGNESFGKKGKAARSEGDIVNALRDLIGADFDLVIIRLGVLTAKNVEAARILHETLMIRDSLNKPTWLIERAGDEFGPSYMTYNDGVWDHIAQHFSMIELPSDPTYVPPEPVAQEDDEEASFGPVGPPKPQPKPMPHPAPAKTASVDVMLPGALGDKPRNGYKGGRS